jgi:hypothetical protein
VTKRHGDPAAQAHVFLHRMRLLWSWREQDAEDPKCQDAFSQTVAEGRALANECTAELRRVQIRQNTLIDSVGAGKISAKAANRKNKALVQEMENLQQAVENLRRALETDNARTIGGFIELSLEDYPKALERNAKKTKQGASTLGRRDAIALGCAAVVGAMAYGLIWKRTGLRKEHVWFQPQPVSSNTGQIDILCVNETPENILLHTAFTPAATAEFQTKVFSLAVEARHNGAYRAFSNTPDLWSQGATNAQQSGPVTIPPGQETTLILHLDVLQHRLPESTNVRILLRRANGETMQQESLDLPAD